MKRRSKWILSVLIGAVLCYVTKFSWEDHRKRLLFGNEEAVDARILAEMRQTFPLGTHRAQVLSELRHRYPGDYDGALTVNIWLNHEPSFVWFCNFMEPYIEFQFASQSPSAPLLAIERKTTGQCL